MSEVRRLYVGIRISTVAIIALSTTFACNNKPTSTRRQGRKIKLRGPLCEAIQSSGRYASPDHPYKSPMTNPDLLQQLKIIPQAHQIRTQIGAHNFYL